MYSVELSRDAAKFLDKLPAEGRERIVKALERLQVRPYARLQRLVNSPLFKFRVGDYRLLLKVEDERLVVFVIEIGHRKNVYK